MRTTKITHKEYEISFDSHILNYNNIQTKIERLEIMKAEKNSGETYIYEDGNRALPMVDKQIRDLKIKKKVLLNKMKRILNEHSEDKGQEE